MHLTQNQFRLFILQLLQHFNIVIIVRNTNFKCRLRLYFLVEPQINNLIVLMSHSHRIDKHIWNGTKHHPPTKF